MSTFTIFLALIVIVAFLLVVVIMVQNPKGGGLSSSFGGSGGGQQMGGVKKTTDFLDKSTWTLATVLLVLILLSNVAIMDSRGVSESRIINENTPEATQEQPVTPAPTSQDNQTSSEGAE